MRISRLNYNNHSTLLYQAYKEHKTMNFGKPYRRPMSSSGDPSIDIYDIEMFSKPYGMLRNYSTCITIATKSGNYGTNMNHIYSEGL
uniref:Uncharacterized protein n=1 Tax=Pararge aegeria TaxID=116150 RepID=S4Q031_9NEOP